MDLITWKNFGPYQTENKPKDVYPAHTQRTWALVSIMGHKGWILINEWPKSYSVSLAIEQSHLGVGIMNIQKGIPKDLVNIEDTINAVFLQAANKFDEISSELDLPALIRQINVSDFGIYESEDFRANGIYDRDYWGNR